MEISRIGYAFAIDPKNGAVIVVFLLRKYYGAAIDLINKDRPDDQLFGFRLDVSVFPDY